MSNILTRMKRRRKLLNWGHRKRAKCDARMVAALAALGTTKKKAKTRSPEPVEEGL